MSAETESNYKTCQNWNELSYADSEIQRTWKILTIFRALYRAAFIFVAFHSGEIRMKGKIQLYCV